MKDFVGDDAECVGDDIEVNAATLLERNDEEHASSESQQHASRLRVFVHVVPSDNQQEDDSQRATSSERVKHTSG